MDVLDLHQLNRATLARQGLLERRSATVAELVTQTGGLQAQLPAPPVIGLWSRLEGFERNHFLDAVRAGELVRGTSLRGTLHLHSVADYRAMRMGVQPLLDVHIRSLGTRGLREEDIAPALAAGAKLLDADALTIKELRAALARQFPHSTPGALVSLVRHGQPLLLAPDPDLPDGWSGLAPFTSARRLIDGAVDPHVETETFVRRFLAAFGPGTPKDVQQWSGVRGVRPVMERMHANGELVELATWEGTPIWDLPEATRPSGDRAAPPRFLPMWDNAVLAFADRSRMMDPAFKPRVASKNGMSPPVFLVDGFAHGTWRVERDRDSATLLLDRWMPLTGAAERGLVAEGERLLQFLHPDTSERLVRMETGA